MQCDYCKSEDLFLKETDGKISLCCEKCGRWIRYVDKLEEQSVADTLERQRREIRLDGATVENVKQRLTALRDRLGSLTADYAAYRSNIEKNNIRSELATSTLKTISSKIQEQRIRIATYEEVLSALGL